MNKKEFIGKVAFNLIQVIRKYNNESEIETWNDLNSERKTQVLKTVNAVIENPTITAKEMHSAWAEAKIFNGWKYAPVTDRSKKLHSCLINFEDLNVFQQMKDDLFNEVVKQLISLDADKLNDFDNFNTDVLRESNKELKKKYYDVLDERNDCMEQIEVLENKRIQIEQILKALRSANINNLENYTYAKELLEKLEKEEY